MTRTASLELPNPTASLVGPTLPTHDLSSDTVLENQQASGQEQSPEQASTIKDKTQFQKLLSSIGHYATVGTLLRLFGSASIIIALCVFLLDGFDAGNHLQRFWVLLSFSSISVVAGVLMSRIFSDQKGARTMVIIALLSVPTCFAVLGGLVYSLFPLDGLHYTYPDYLFWQAGSFSQLALAGTVCTVIAAAVSWFGFSVLAQQVRLPLFSSLMLSSALLLIPVRNSAWVTLVGFAMISIIAIVLLRYVMPRLTLKTHWSSFSVLLTLLPLCILICRGAWLYDMSSAMMFASAAGLHCALLYIARSARNWPLSMIEFALIVSGATAVFFAVPLLDDLARSGFPLISNLVYSLRSSVVLLLLTGLIVHLDLTLKSHRLAKLSRILFSATFILTFIASSLSHASSLIELAAVAAVAALITAYGLYRGYHSLVISGATVIASLVLFHHNDFLAAIYSTGILGILAFGTACVFSAHLFEKYGPLLRARYALKVKSGVDDPQAELETAS